MEILYDNIIIDFLPLCALAGDDIILSKEINLKTVYIDNLGTNFKDLRSNYLFCLLN